MPLTPTDVANKQFKIVFRGYSLDEVDGFLDEVESELTRLMRDNNDLRSGGAARSTPQGAVTPVFQVQAPEAEGAAQVPAPADLTKASPSHGVPDDVAAPGPASPYPTSTGSAGAEPAAGAPVGDPTGTAVEAPVEQVLPVEQAPAAGDGGRAALRMLQLAQQTAEQAVAEARAEADELLARTRAEATAQVEAANTEADETLAAARAEAVGSVAAAREQAEQALAAAQAEADSILGPARSEAEATLAAARAEAERLLGGARERSERLNAEISAKADTAMGDLETRRATLEQHVEQLRAFEREYRTRLKAYLEGQLRELGAVAQPDPDQATGSADGAASGDPGRATEGATMNSVTADQDGR